MVTYITTYKVTFQNKVGNSIIILSNYFYEFGCEFKDLEIMLLDATKK